MKRLFPSILLAGLLLMVSSCNNEVADDFADDSASNVESVLEQAKKRIFSMGLDTTDMVEIDGYYVVENDILINKDSLSNALQTRQYHATYTVATGQVVTIGVNDNNLLSNWGTALSDVAYIYSNNTGLTIKFMGYDPNADIVISKESLSYSNVCAEGEFPVNNSGKPGNRVRINSTFYKDIDTFLSHEEKIFLMMHEIGHNLGLRHTNCAVNGEGDAGIGMVKIPGTPDTDSNSYMNSATCGYSWKGMPEYDAVALKYLFPVVYNTIHFENCTGIADIKFKKGTEYELSRTLIPQKDGYVFAGWHHAKDFYTPFNYKFKITGDKTLYARWKTKGNLVNVECVSRDGINTKTFDLTSGTVVTFTSKIERSLNTWLDLTMHQGTYSKLERIGEFTMTYDVRDMGYYIYDQNPYSFIQSKTFVLEAGKYVITSSLTTELGEQNLSSGKHGIVTTTVSYY